MWFIHVTTITKYIGKWETHVKASFPNVVVHLYVTIITQYPVHRLVCSSVGLLCSPTTSIATATSTPRREAREQDSSTTKKISEAHVSFLSFQMDKIMKLMLEYSVITI